MQEKQKGILTSVHTERNSLFYNPSKQVVGKLS